MARRCRYCNTPLRDGTSYCSTCNRILKKTEMRYGPALPEKTRKTLLQLGAGIAFVLISFWSEIQGLFAGQDLKRWIPFLVIAALFIIALVARWTQEKPAIRTPRRTSPGAGSQTPAGPAPGPVGTEKKSPSPLEDWLKRLSEATGETGETGDTQTIENDG